MVADMVGMQKHWLKYELVNGSHCCLINEWTLGSGRFARLTSICHSPKNYSEQKARWPVLANLMVQWV